MIGVPLSTIIVLWTGAFIGALAAGGAGFAFALVASSIWLHVLDPVDVTPLAIACGTILHCMLIWPVRRSIEAARLTPFLLGAIVGVPLGVLILTRTEAGPLKQVLGAALAAYGLYALLAPRLPNVTSAGRAADGVVGLAGGLLTGIGGYSGVLPTIWTQIRGWSKQTARGVYQPYILFANVLTLALVGRAAVASGATKLLLLALPAAALGAWIGFSIFERLNEHRFRQLLSGLLFVSGLSLLL